MSLLSKLFKREQKQPRPRQASMTRIFDYEDSCKGPHIWEEVDPNFTDGAGGVHAHCTLCSSYAIVTPLNNHSKVVPLKLTELPAANDDNYEATPATN